MKHTDKGTAATTNRLQYIVSPGDEPLVGRLRISPSTALEVHVLVVHRRRVVVDSSLGLLHHDGTHLVLVGVDLLVSVTCAWVCGGTPCGELRRGRMLTLGVGELLLSLVTLVIVW